MAFGLILRDTPGLVYFARAPLFEIVKIGWSRQPLLRLAQLQSEVRCDLVLIGAFQGSKVDERVQQKRFAHLWYGSEWFLEDGEILSYASSLPVVTQLQDLPYGGAQEPRAPDFQSAWRKWAPAPGPCWSRRARKREYAEYVAQVEAEEQSAARRTA